MDATTDVPVTIDIQKDNGPWQIFSQGKSYVEGAAKYPLTDRIAGAREFRLRIRARNQSKKDVLVIDGLGLTGKAETTTAESE